MESIVQKIMSSPVQNQPSSQQGQDFLNRKTQNPQSIKDPDVTITDDDIDEMGSDTVLPGIQSETALSQEKSSQRMDYNQGRWNRQEHSLFIEGLVKYGNNWKNVQKNIGSRSSTQARSHAQKFFMTLKKEINKGKTKEERKAIIFKIFNTALSHLIFTPNESFYENVEKLIYASEEDIKMEEKGGKKKYRHHPHIHFDKSIIQYQKEKIFHIQKIKKAKTPKNKLSSITSFPSFKTLNSSTMKQSPVINIVTINVLNNSSGQKDTRKNSNPFDLFFDSNELSTINNSNLNNNSSSSHNLYEKEENKNVTNRNDFFLNDEENDLNNMSFDIDMLLA